YRGTSSADVYVYFELPAETSTVAALDAVLDCGRTVAIAAPSIDRLQGVFDVPGASASAIAAFHYVVETDAADGWQSEMFHWYDTEHMPGLAAVPGCVRARRFLNLGRGPYSLACYDLVAPAVTAPAGAFARDLANAGTQSVTIETRRQARLCRADDDLAARLEHVLVGLRRAETQSRWRFCGR